MARGAWDHTAELLAAIAEIGRFGSGRQPYTRNDFHPMRETPKKASTVMPYEPKVLEAIQARWGGQ